MYTIFLMVKLDITNLLVMSLLSCFIKMLIFEDMWLFIIKQRIETIKHRDYPSNGRRILENSNRTIDRLAVHSG